MTEIAGLGQSESRSYAPLPHGTWSNQLGSRLTLAPDGTGGLRGTYCGGTGALAGAMYPVFGSYDATPSQAATVLGFVVEWTEAHTVTSWAGRYHHADGSITATWLMTTETETADDWKSTFVGHDFFLRAGD